MNSPVLFQNETVCIFHPDSKMGVEVFTKVGFSQEVPQSLPLETEGLLSQNSLRTRFPQLPSRTFMKDLSHNDTIFFRAPFFGEGSEALTLQGIASLQDLLQFSGQAIVCIRVDPERTHVVSEDARFSKKEFAPRLLSESLEARKKRGVPIFDEEIAVVLPQIPPSWFSRVEKKRE